MFFIQSLGAVLVVVQHHVAELAELAELAKHFVVVVKVVEPEKQLNVVVHPDVKLEEHVKLVKLVDIEDKNLISKPIPKNNNSFNNSLINY